MSAICVTAIVGWIFDLPALTSVAPGWARMSLPTALSFLLCGASALQLGFAADRRRRTNLFRIAAASLVTAAAVYALGDFAVAGGLRGAPESSKSGYLFGPSLGRVSPATAFNLLMAAGALLLPAGRRAGRAYGALIAVGLVVTGLDLVGYAYGVQALYKVLPFSAMSLPTALSFALLFVSALLARPGDSWVAAIIANDSGGSAARRLLPVVLAAPLLLAGAAVLAYRTGALDAPFGFAILAVAMSVSLAALTVAIARWLTRRDLERRQSQRLLEAVVDNTPAVMYVKDLAGRYLMVNRRYEEIFHVDRGAMIGKTDYDVFPREAADAFRAVDERVAQADGTLTEEEIAPHDDGPHSYISVKSPLRDDAGAPYAVFGISTDITERMRAQNALTASEERTRLIVETALDAVVTMDGAGVITGWNPQAETIFGWTRGEALGRSVETTIIPERYRGPHRQGLARYLATGEARVLNRRVELVALHRDGREFPVELAITPIGAGGGMAFAGFVRDIAERKLAEAKLKTQLERLGLLDQVTRAIGQRQDVQSIFQVVVRSIEDQLPADFACLCLYDGLDKALTIAAVGVKSHALALELAMPERARIDIDENGLSRCVRGQLVYEPDIAKIESPFPQRLSRGRLRSLVAAPLQVESKVFGVLVVARFAADGFVSGECEFLRQLSEHAALAVHQAQLHGALQAAYDDLRQSQQTIMQQERLRALGQMASGIAHDINNALSPVALYTESLLETETGLSPTARSYLETIQRSVEDIAHTIARMKEFYRQREPQLILAPVSANEIVRQVIDLTKARWSDMVMQKGTVIDVRTDLGRELPAIMGVESEVREALINLVLNAVDAMPDGGVLTLRTQNGTPGNGGGRPTVEIEVEDTGVGMDPETRGRCLEPFFTTKGERGTGLGLAMVYGVAQRHGADMEINSAQGKGTAVRLGFPAAAASAAGRVEPRSAPTDRLKLLLVDDDPALLKALRDALEADGHLVTVANDGQAGIGAFRGACDRGESFAAVITDLGMPYVDGRRVAAEVKAMSPSTPVILLTGWGHGLLADAEVPPHVDQMLSKPPRLRDIRQSLAQLCPPSARARSDA
ncbi:MAG TPA: PAS domain S-box protein [Alphaproteobacteria bacterium]|nr:PAS domain S-box protein [Alphaproteobacteria bacterium]